LYLIPAVDVISCRVSKHFHRVAFAPFFKASFENTVVKAVRDEHKGDA
jgi:hypothetical protein